MALFAEKKKKEDVQQTAIFDESQIKVEKKRKKEKVKLKSSFADIAPYVDITANGYIELSDDAGFLEIVQLTSKDIFSLNEEDKNKNIYTLAYFFQWYLDDLKIIPLNFPVDTSVQQQHIMRKMENSTKREYLPHLQERLEELQFIEQERTNREYFMLIFGEDELTLQRKTKHVERLLHLVLPVIHLEEEKKISILYKLFNLNSKYRT